MDSIYTCYHKFSDFQETNQHHGISAIGRKGLRGEPSELLFYNEAGNRIDINGKKSEVDELDGHQAPGIDEGQDKAEVASGK
jgi:hypothetical protein